jgi:PPOX class probable F420-dependent enzyme
MGARSSLTTDELAFVSAQRSARLATSDAEGHPYVVPVCFAYDGERFYTPLDEKPKRADVGALRRVRNIRARGEAALLVDRYDDDWSRLGWVLAHGRAELLPPGHERHAVALRLLRERYPQYRAMALEDLPVIALTPEHVTSWGPALSARDAADPWMQPGRGLDFVPLARGRRSVRVFQPRPVPRVALETMLEALGAEGQRTLEMDGEAPEIVAERLVRSRERIQHAPALVLACLYLADLDSYPDADRQHAEEVMAIQSLGAAIQNMLLAAYSQGLDTGWMCAPLFCPDTVRAALALDTALIPHALLPVGYAAQDPKRRPRLPLEELVVRFD